MAPGRLDKFSFLSNSVYPKQYIILNVIFEYACTLTATAESIGAVTFIVIIV